MEVIMLYTLYLHSTIYQLYLNKTGGKYVSLFLGLSRPLHEEYIFLCYKNKK